jgi:prepilin-type N-terminal cleavage/methylation domain-containing protein
MWRARTKGRRNGFTLIEVLAALAIACVIIIAATALIHDVARHFDRGTRGVDRAEHLLLAVDRLAQDFGSARFVVWTTESGPAVAFAAEQASGDAPAKVAFVANGGVMSGPQGNALVTLTIEPAGDATRLVRRRTLWTGRRMRIENASPQDAVVLLEDAADMAFLFGRITPNGALSWSENWIGQPSLPRFVRLILRDRETGLDLLGEADFVVRADAPPACGRPDANPGCLSLVPPEAAGSSESGRGSP